MKEVFKPVLGFEQDYEISNLGSVKRFGRFKKGKGDCNIWLPESFIAISKNKFSHVQLSLISGSIKKGSSVHREVWRAFKGEIPKGFVINHINGIKSDNNILNLECITQSENILHAYKTGLISYNKR
jgi:hypothetical protein